MMRDFWKKQTGSVLMEVVIALPLHLMLFLSVIYLGMLSFDRMSLAAIENYMLLQPAADFAKLTDFYHKGDDDITLKSNPSTPPGAADGYLYLSENRIEATRKLPVWLAGLKKIGKNHFNGYEISPDDGIVFGNDNTAGGSGAVLLRNPSYSKDRSNMTDWAAAANEIFIAGPAPVTVSGAPVNEYTRNGNLQAWSR